MISVWIIFMMVSKWWFFKFHHFPMLIYNTTLLLLLILSLIWPVGSPKMICLLSDCSCYFNNFLLSTTTRCSRPILDFPSPSLRMSYFFKDLWLLLIENGIISQDLDSRCPHCCCVSLLLGPLSRYLGNRYMWFGNVCVCVYTTDSNPTLQNLF